MKRCYWCDCALVGRERELCADCADEIAGERIAGGADCPEYSEAEYAMAARELWRISGHPALCLGGRPANAYVTDFCKQWAGVR